MLIRIKRRIEKQALLRVLVLVLVTFSFTPSFTQLPHLDRLSKAVFDVEAPSSRVTGTPGSMVYLERDCRSISVENLRNRVVNTAIQEWAYFGYSIYDLTNTRDDNPKYRRQPWQRPSIDPAEAARVADSIAGYWSSTPDSAWILERQNQVWSTHGVGTRWGNPWSAAFISWVMCESGLGDLRKFRRAIAHHSYIDQAITAREDNESLSAYIAYDTGEQVIEPGDMLCRGSRPNYASLAARREQLGVGARTHCDIVVKLDPHNQRIMLIGGNVRGWVNLKLLPAEANEAGLFAPVAYNGRHIFAHLKLQADAVPNNAFEQSPTLQSLSCDHQTGLSNIVNEPDCS